MIFILIAGVMLCIAAACVVVPLWRGHISARPSYELSYRQEHARQKDELARDLASGRLAESDHAAALRDLERELAVGLETSSKTDPHKKSASRNRVLAVATGLILVLAMGIGYWRMGNWRVGVEGIHAASIRDTDQMVAQLAHRLQTTDPNDLRGWTMLGHAYVLMGRYQEAAKALGRARQLSGDSDPDLLAAYAEALALAEPDEFMQKAAPLFEEVLQMDPTNIRALWYGGLASLHEGNKQLAVKRWQMLLAQNLPPQYQAVVKKAIEEAGGQPVALAAPVVAESDIHVRVTLDSKLRNRVSPDATVFVYAEPAGAAGGPPLAVRRFQVSDLPLNVTLSDKDAMVPGRDISKYSNIVLVARISSSGDPMPQKGDPEGKTTWTRKQGGKLTTIEVRP